MINLHSFNDYSINSKIAALFEGGNSRVVDPDTGEVTDLAYKIELDKFNREQTIKDFIKYFTYMNDEFEKEYNDKIWRDFSVITSGEAFNGSSEHFFNMDITDREFTQFKSKVGDVDLTVPHNKLPAIFDLLQNKLRNKTGPGNITYLGNPKKTLGGGHQVNGVFRYEQKGNVVNAQVDFEGVE